MIALFRRKPAWLLWLPLIAVAIFYAPGLGGFWHGDDVPNLHRVFAQTRQGILWPETLRLFAEPIPSQGAFYRPMMMLSLAVNYALAGANYGAWYFVNFAVHLSNTLLVALIIRRLAERHDGDATIAAPLAALFFGLCPGIAEGVYWVSARADGWVTMLTLAGLYFWVDRETVPTSRRAYLLPLLLIFALGFKESAVILPLQVALLAVVWRGQLSRPQWRSLIASVVITGLYLAWRAYLFGDAWHVYTPVDGASAAVHSKLWAALLSLGPWWAALGGPMPVLAALYPVGCVVGIVLAALSGPGPHWRTAMALAAAGGGLALATMFNLGAMSANGEGGRLWYAPVAWIALGCGVLMSYPKSRPHPLTRARSATLAAFLFAVLIGGGVLWPHLHAAWRAQDNMRMMAREVPAWAESHTGLTMLLVPDHDGALVAARNAHGVVLEPLQTQPYLHRVLPTLSSEIAIRQKQFSNGLARQLELVRPRFANADMLAAIATRAEGGWPPHVACWSKSAQQIVPLQAPPMESSAEVWLAIIHAEWEKCGH